MAAKRSAQERAYAHIRTGLQDGSLPDGAFLTESAVAEDLGISRTPVREALRRLDAERLVRLVPGRGAFVPEVSPKTIREVMDVRALVESHAIDEAGPPDPSRLDELHRLLDEQRACADVTAFVRLDREFHQRIVDAAGNAVLSELYGSLRDRQNIMGVRAVLSADHRRARVIAEHEQIVQALASEGPSGAVRASAEHHRATLESLMEGRA